MLRFGKKSAQFLRHRFWLAARVPLSVVIPRSRMIESRELNPCDMWQDILEGVKVNFQVSRALAPAEQKHLGFSSPEALKPPTRLDDHLKVIPQCGSERPHR